VSRALPRLLVGLLLLPGCIFLDGGGADDDDSAALAGGYAPRVDQSFPTDSNSQFIATDSFASFSAHGSDDDSLYLEWDWSLDGELQTLGSAEDGSFSTEIEVSWAADLSGSLSELRFAVTDGSYETELFWSLSFE